MDERQVISSIENALFEFDSDKVISLVREALKKGIDPNKIMESLIRSLNRIGDMFAKQEVFLPELIISGEAVKACMEILVPLIAGKEGGRPIMLGRVLIGTVEGDIHDIGKNIVKAFLEANGFEVIDLGVDVPVNTFVEKVKELKPDVLGMSALLTTTAEKMREVIEKLKEAGLRDKVRIIIGGAATSESFAKSIGADAWGADAKDALVKVKKLLNIGE
ncbi:MAG: corrinoid protein [Desulfurococcaceae archaeon]